MPEIPRERLLEAIVHHPKICITGLESLPLRSQQRALIEEIFRKLIRINPELSYKLTKQCRLTFPTWKAVIDSLPTENRDCNMLMLSYVYESLGESLNHFIKDNIQLDETDYPTLFKFADTLKRILMQSDSCVYRMSNIPELSVSLSQFLPDTPTWDSIRTILKDIVYKNWDPSCVIPYTILKWASANVQSVNDKIFRTFSIDEPNAQEIRKKITNIPLNFNLYMEQLKFAIHNETEFLECWNPASTRVRRILASYYFHISPTLLETFLKKYSRTQLLNILLKHPQIPDSYIIFYATQQNPVALQILKEKQAKNHA